MNPVFSERYPAKSGLQLGDTGDSARELHTGIGRDERTDQRNSGRLQAAA